MPAFVNVVQDPVSAIYLGTRRREQVWQAGRLGDPWDHFMGTRPWVLSHAGGYAEDGSVEGSFLAVGD